MIARGWACLHTACPELGRRAPLPVPKNLAAKPSVSITSKLIEIKRLQVLCSGHLQKNRGEGELPAGTDRRVAHPKTSGAAGGAFNSQETSWVAFPFGFGFGKG